MEKNERGRCNLSVEMLFYRWWGQHGCIHPMKINTHGTIIGVFQTSATAVSELLNDILNGSDFVKIVSVSEQALMVKCCFTYHDDIHFTTYCYKACKDFGSLCRINRK